MNFKKTVFVVFILFLLAVIILLSSIITQKNRPLSQNVRAFYYGDTPMTCENNCTPNPCLDSTPSDPCCQQIQQTGNPDACPWPERGFCKESECASIPPDVDRKKCGFSRKGWCQKCTATCCVNPDGSINHIPEYPPPDFSHGCPDTLTPATGHQASPTPNPSNPPNATNTPPPNLTSTPNPSQPAKTGSGTLKVVVHKDSTSGQVWSSDFTVADPYTSKESLLVYITGPSAKARFGELLYLPGKDGKNCTSRGGFPYQCSPGTAVWKGADGKSGTATGSYTADIQQVPPGWQIKAGAASGNLTNASTLTLDLALSQTSAGTTTTPSPTTSQPPTPTTAAAGPSVLQKIKEFFSGPNQPGQPTPTLPSANPPQQPGSPLEPLNNIANTVGQQTSQVLDFFGYVVERARYFDGILENTINERLRSIFR